MQKSCYSHLPAWSAALAAATFAISVSAQGPAPARTAVSLDRVTPIDRVIAIVNDEALTQYDINEQKRIVLSQMKSQNVTPPAPDVLDKQLADNEFMAGDEAKAPAHRGWRCAGAVTKQRF